MARRMDIELTSQRDDDTWTWRAAGARQPRGTVEAALLPPATKVGDVVRAEVEGFLDGMSVVAVLPPKQPRREPERLELLTPRSSESRLVTTSGARAGRGRTERPRRGERPGRGERDHGRRRPERERDRERERERPRGGRERPRDREAARSGAGAPEGPAPEAKPKARRLRPGRTHRTALLESLPAEQRPIAEQLLQGGIPAVRQAIEKQNETLKGEGKPQVNPEPLLEIAEKLRNRAQAASWRDRADAALAHVDDLDLRDLRSVVNAAEDAGRDEEARNLAHQLREALANRVEKEQAAWVSEVADNLREGRVVRALRLTSRPPKAGSPVPADLAEQLVIATSDALTAETGPQRWATVLDALAYSPIRRRVVPASLPEKLAPDLRETIARLATRLPEIAHIFDIAPAPAPSRPNRPTRRRSGKKPSGGDGGGSSGGGGRGGGGRGAGRGSSTSNGARAGDDGAGSGESAEPAEPPAQGEAETPAPDAAESADATPAPEASESGAPAAAEAEAAPPAEADAPALASEGDGSSATAEAAPEEASSPEPPATPEASEATEAPSEAEAPQDTGSTETSGGESHEAGTPGDSSGTAPEPSDDQVTSSS